MGIDRCSGCIEDPRIYPSLFSLLIHYENQQYINISTKNNVFNANDPITYNRGKGIMIVPLSKLFLSNSKALSDSELCIF